MHRSAHSATLNTPVLREDALSQFNRLLAVRAASLFDFEPETVYHYTAAAAFQAIIEQKQIRATNFSFLNDPSEVQYGRRTVEEEIANIRSNADVVVADFLNRVASHLTLERFSEVYVVSFTAAGDDLSQWRAYGTSFSDRFSIGFDAPSLYSLVGGLQNALYARVVYGSVDQRERVNSILRRAIEFLQQESLLPALATPFAIATAMHLARLLPVLKDPAYASEQERRIVIWHAKDDPSPKIDSSRGVLRPYIPVELGDPLPIVAVNVMAPSRREAAVKAASFFCRQMASARSFRRTQSYRSLTSFGGLPVEAAGLPPGRPTVVPCSG